MTTTLLVNLPTADAARARDFFATIGFTVDQLVSDVGTVVVQVGASRVVLHRIERFACYAAAPPCADSPISPTMLAVAVDRRGDVDRIVDAALLLGAGVIRTVDDPDFMYSRSFRDLDGHGWDVVWMDPAQLGR